MSAENRTSKEQFAELLDEMTSPQQIRPVRRLGEKLRKILADYEIPEEMAEAFGALQRKVFEQHEEIERLQRELREEQERYDELRTGHAKCSPDEPAELPVIPANVTRFRYRDATRDIIESDWGDYVKYRDYVDLRAAYDCATEMNKQQSAKLRPPEPPLATPKFKVGDAVEWPNEYGEGSYSGTVEEVQVSAYYLVRWHMVGGRVGRPESDLRPAVTKPAAHTCIGCSEHDVPTEQTVVANE